MRGVTTEQPQNVMTFIISTHTPHARRDKNIKLVDQQICISTHTPHARRDSAAEHLRRLDVISTHTPHARRDRANPAPDRTRDKFLLTRLMRGVTCVRLPCVQS